MLTSKSCSEEGLEDSTKLLLRLSNANNATKQNIVKLLLSGAQQIGHTVCEHIESLLKEVGFVVLRPSIVIMLFLVTLKQIGLEISGGLGKDDLENFCLHHHESRGPFMTWQLKTISIRDRFGLYQDQVMI